ncbi:MAG: hypothetical protein JKY09_08035 [Crocinitomicaceae bacterium]|nr:hypothetical protein [Crocinitomicaceae bacterium]
MSKETEDERLNTAFYMLENMASLDFTKRLELSNQFDLIDGISTGLNMLSEELQSNVVERSELIEINTNLEKFAYIAAHDLKSPLGLSVSLTRLLENELQDNKNERVTKYLRLLEETNMRFIRLINALLEYSKSTSVIRPVTKIDLDTLIQNSTSLYCTNDKVVINIQDRMPVVQYSEITLAQIIDNLLANAVKYNDKEICEIDIERNEQGDNYHLSISDNGPGIELQYHNKIFDLFENLRTDKENSSGIGLATVKKLITEAKGQIWVDSSKSNGAKFTFTIKKENVLTI